MNLFCNNNIIWIILIALAVIYLLNRDDEDSCNPCQPRPNPCGCC